MSLKELICSKCGDYFRSKYTDEQLKEKYPYKEGDRSLKNLRNINKWVRLKRNLICPTCGNKKKISKKLLIKLSKKRHDEKRGRK